MLRTPWLPAIRNSILMLNHENQGIAQPGNSERPFSMPNPTTRASVSSRFHRMYSFTIPKKLICE
jgi:hypothetical protein